MVLAPLMHRHESGLYADKICRYKKYFPVIFNCLPLQTSVSKHYLYPTVCKKTNWWRLDSLYSKKHTLVMSVEATFHVPRPKTGICVPSFSSRVLATCVSSMEYNKTTAEGKQKENLSTHLLHTLSELSSSSFPLRLQLLSQRPFSLLSLSLFHVCLSFSLSLSPCFFPSHNFFLSPFPVLSVQ